ncbi:hypothetical protein UYO_0471 [Lachnospiraceae bacterium JC7]|nr:hypothetical protein UYO_0471 [Lachnospiraceae bacterium JC7]
MKKYIIAAAAGLVLTLAACGSTEVPGSTTQAPVSEIKEVSGSAEGFGGTITVTLRMQGEDIIEASILGNDESPEIGGKALSELEKQLVEKDGFDIDGVSGATYTSEGVRNAAKDALGLFLPEMEESTTEAAETTKK